MHLTREEKQFMQNSLVSFMQSRPVRDDRSARQLWQRSSVQSFYSFIFKPMPIIIAIVLLLGGGTAYAAEHSLPNQILYPVKIHINEEVRGFLALTPQAKADLDAHLAEVRLQEEETLAAQGQLTTSTKAQVEANFKAHADRVAARIADFKAKGNIKDVDAIVAHFETSLLAHEAILAKFAEHFSTSTLGSASSTTGMHVTSTPTSHPSSPSSTRTSHDQQDQDADVDESANVRAEIRPLLPVQVNVHADEQVKIQGRGER